MQLQGKREEAPQGCHPWRSAGVGRATGEEPTPGSMATETIKLGDQGKAREEEELANQALTTLAA